MTLEKVITAVSLGFALYRMEGIYSPFIISVCNTMKFLGQALACIISRVKGRFLSKQRY